MIKFRVLVTFVAIIVTFGASAQTDRLSFDDFYDLVVFWLVTKLESLFALAKSGVEQCFEMCLAVG